MPTTATSEPEQIISGCRLFEDLGRGTGRLKVPTAASTALEDA